MIRAGALFYAIVMSLIIAIVSGSLILFSYLTRIEFETLEVQQQLRLNADSGINMLLAGFSSEASSGAIDLYGNGTDTVEMTRKNWGAFDVLIAVAKFKGSSSERMILAGSKVDSSKAFALYLADRDRPLAVCGKTRIKGRAYISRAGVKRAYIEGQSFVGSTLVDGRTNSSEKQIPEFNKELLSRIRDIIHEGKIGEGDIAVEFQESGDSVFNSFRLPTQVYYSEAGLKIPEGKYIGNLAFISKRMVVVPASCKLEDVIIAAPKIVIEESFSGTLQAFASDSIVIAKNVNLKYPSVLGLVTAVHSRQAGISLSENDSLHGEIFAIKTPNEPGSGMTGVTIAEKAFVYGEVYTNGIADIRGTVYGSLCSELIMLRTPSSIYENHLLGTVLDETKRSVNYVGILDRQHHSKACNVKFLK
jgi:hypothetical protein